MAVNDSNENQNTQSNAPQAEAVQGYQGYQAGPDVGRANTQGTRPGLGNINSLFGRAGSFDRSETRSAEALRALKDIERQALEAQGLTDEFELVRFDRDANRVGLSSILVTKTIKVGGKLYTAVRTLLLESAGSTLRPRAVQMGAQRIEVPTRPQDVFNDVYWNRISDALVRQRGAEVTVLDAGPLVIPADFDFKDELAATRLLIGSANRCDDVVARIRGEEPFTVNNVKRVDERLTARIDYTGEPKTDVVGNPIRADIVVTMSRQTANQQHEDDFYDHETEFNSVSGFINLEYAPAAQQQQPMGWGQQQMETQLFTPTFVITQVAQADWIQANTPELYLLAISNAYRVTAGTSWARALLPQVGRKGIDPRDIGALGYMTQAGQKIDTKSDKFSDQDFIDLMTALVRPNPTFLIDVNPVGDHSGIENYLIDAAFDGPNRTKAQQRLVQAADNLTGGLFSSKFNVRETPVVVPYGQEIHLGFYTDEAGDKRDIRDLDVLAMLNLTEGNVTDFMDWYRTLCDASLPNELRLQRREQIERQYLTKALKITGRAPRLLLTPQFIEALDAATREAGVHVEMDNVTNVMGAQRFTGNNMVNQYAVSRPAAMTYGQGNITSTAGPTHAGVTGNGRIY